MMTYYVVVANASMARFFRLVPREIPELESGPNLVEEGKIQNPEAVMPDRDLFSSPKSGRNRDPLGGSNAGHGYDDHREEHRREMEKHFAEHVGKSAMQKIAKAEAEKIILVAGTRMLGILRPFFDDLRKHGADISEHDADLVNLTPESVQEHLAKRNLLPAKKPPQRTM